MTTSFEAAYCTSRQAAELLGVSLSTVQRWTETGLLDTWKTRGGHRRISRSSVQQLAKGNHILPKPTRPTPRERELDRIKILIVEDDNILAKLYPHVIGSWGLSIEIITAGNGIEALICVGRDRPDLMIADLGMPGMDGFQLINNLAYSSFREGMQIVVVTGLDAESIAQSGGLPEGIHVLPKPIPFAALHALCIKIIEQRNAYLEPARNRSGISGQRETN